MTESKVRPPPGVAYLPVHPLTATHYGGGLTRYFYRNSLLYEAKRGDAPAHYDAVVPMLRAALRAANPKHPSPLREANLIWMAVRRTYQTVRNGAPSVS